MAKQPKQQQKQKSNGLLSMFGFKNFLDFILSISLLSWIYDNFKRNSQKSLANPAPSQDQLDNEDEKPIEAQEEDLDLLAGHDKKSQAQKEMEAADKLKKEHKKELERQEEGQDSATWLKDPVQRRLSANFDSLYESLESEEDLDYNLTR